MDESRTSSWTGCPASAWSHRSTEAAPSQGMAATTLGANPFRPDFPIHRHCGTSSRAVGDQWEIVASYIHAFYVFNAVAINTLVKTTPIRQHVSTSDAVPESIPNVMNGRTRGTPRLHQAPEAAVRKFRRSRAVALRFSGPSGEWIGTLRGPFRALLA